MKIERATEDIAAIFSKVIEAMDPSTLVDRALILRSDSLIVSGTCYPLGQNAELRVLAIGKAALSMARGAEAALGSRLSAGLAITKEGLDAGTEPLQQFEVVEAGHPLPDERSVEAGRRALEFVRGLSADDVVLVLISGGGSALVELPDDGLTLSDIVATTDRLLRAGADIYALNAVRRPLSQIKGGQLALAAAPARIVNLIISDVLGNALPVIASGPTVPPSERHAGGDQLLRSLIADPSLPESVRSRLERTRERSTDSYAHVVQTEILADARAAAEAAATGAAALGYRPVVLGTKFTGEAREFGRFWSVIADEARRADGPFERPACLIGAGELTVTVRGDGRGGRNTEMALAAARAIAGVEDLAIASLATDGDDGTTGAAGGIVVGTSIQRATELGLSPEELLENNDSQRFLEATEGLIRTGGTGTNVNDLYLALIP